MKVVLFSPARKMAVNLIEATDITTAQDAFPSLTVIEFTGQCDIGWCSVDNGTSFQPPDAEV